MLKLSEFWSARAHSEDFTLTRMGFMTVRLRLLICVLMVGLPAWALVDWLTLPATQFEALLQARVFCLLALSPLIPLSYLIHFRRERMKLALGYLMGVMMLFSLICLHSFGADQELQAGYMAFPYLLISLFAIFPIPLSLSLQLSGGILVTMLAGNWLLVGQSLWSVQTLNQIWLLGLFAVASAWVQCGQLNMLLQLYRESTTDELTGMMNRRLLMKQLEKARAAMIRKQAPSRCCCWIWIASNASTIPSAIWREMRYCGRWRRPWRSSWSPAWCWGVTVARSLPSCCPVARSWPRRSGWRSGCGWRWRRGW